MIYENCVIDYELKLYKPIMFSFVPLRIWIRSPFCAMYTVLVLSVCVIPAKCGPGETCCYRNYHTGSFEWVFVCLQADFFNTTPLEKSGYFSRRVWSKKSFVSWLVWYPHKKISSTCLICFMWWYKVLNKLLVQKINGVVHLNVLYSSC